MIKALARKKRSEAVLQKEGVPFISHLPVIEDDTTAKFRPAEDVAWRAMALCLVACKGEGLEQEHVLRILKQYELEHALTPKERRFIFNDEPSDHDRVQFTWRYECYWVLLWALSYIEDLGRPDQICDVPRAVGIMVQRNSQVFIEGARLRDHSDILDAVDLVYRYDWACVNARLKGQEAPAGLEAEVVMEWHYALNWLVRYMDQEWDDVKTDT